MALFDRKPKGPAVSITDLRTLFGVQNMELDEFLRSAGMAATDLGEAGQKQVDAGEKASVEALAAYQAAMAKANSLMDEGDEQIAEAAAAERILKRLRPTAQDTGSPS